MNLTNHGIDIHKERGIPLDRQALSLRELCGPPHSKLDDDAFTRVRILIATSLEAESVRLQHALARADRSLQPALARIRRAEAHQQALLANLLPPDLSTLEATIAREQAATEVAAAAAHRETNPYLAQVYRFTMLEEVDHLYRFSALYDRLEGKDANTITQCATDLGPGRPTAHQHRAPVDDLRDGYDRSDSDLQTRLLARLHHAMEAQARETYLAVGPTFADPVARMLYAEVACVEEQHLTQAGSLFDPTETPLERWLLHEATEVWTYATCLAGEANPRIRATWEKMLQWELGHLHAVMDLYRQVEGRDPAQVVPAQLPAPLDLRSHRTFIEGVLKTERDLTALGSAIVPRAQEPGDGPSATYRRHFGRDGFASEAIAAGWRWSAGTELLSHDSHARA
jgi:rubrerythrin